MRLIATAATLAALATPAVALAATKNGITPTTPKAGTVVPAGKALVFKGKVSGPGSIFVHVCRSARKSARDGTICTKETIGEAKKSGGSFSYTQRVFAFDEYFLNRAGTYYWQAHRIQCTTGSSDCRKEGPVVKFVVR